MSKLRRSFIEAVLYLAVIFIFGLTDYDGRPIINFASYFYLAMIVAVPVTFLFPSISSMSSLVPLSVWAGIYLVALQIINRENSANAGELSVIVLEFVLLETGVWLIHRLAIQIRGAETIMDALAINAFPNRAHDIDLEDQRIKVELARSRRYNRPLSLVLVAVKLDDQDMTREMLRSIQHDLAHRFTSARIAQIIDDQIRQTDLMLRDNRGNFILVCPETNSSEAMVLVQRLYQIIQVRAAHEIRYGIAAFPEDALTFDDLLQKARERVRKPASLEQAVLVTDTSSKLV